MSAAGPFFTNGVQTVAPPPEGYVVNFQNPQKQFAVEHYLVFGFLGTLATVTVGQRFYTKLFLSNGLGADDGFMFLAWLTSTAVQALLVHSIAVNGMGVHLWEMPIATFIYSLTLSYIAGGLFSLCNGFTKLSLLTFYLQLSPARWWKIAIWVCLAAVGCMTTIITTLLYFHCDPVSKAWNPTVEGTCLDVGILYIATAVTTIITDVMLLLLPIPMVIGLQMSRSRKISAIAIFAVGSVTIMTSSIRLAGLPTLLNAQDITWDAAPPNIWSFVEANLFVICGSMPTLRKFFKHFAPRLMGSSTNPSYNPSYGANYARSQQSRSRKEHRSYSRFPEEERELHTLSSTKTNLKVNAGKGPIVEVEEGVRGDDTSEKAILQTKTYTVRYD